MSVIQTIPQLPTNSTALSIKELPQLPDFATLNDAEYSRVGQDLIIQFSGQTIVVHDYFIHPVPLISADGVALPVAEVVALLNQAEPILVAATELEGVIPKVAGEIIGTVTTLVNGPVSAESSDGSVRTLQENDPVYLHDLLYTAPQTYVKITLLDKSIFQLGPLSKAQINQYSYNSQTPDEGGHLSGNILVGIFRFVSGEISGDGGDQHSVFNTPSATIGVRGSEIDVRVDTNGATTLLHSAGFVEVKSLRSDSVLSVYEPGTIVYVSIAQIPPSAGYASPESIQQFRSQLNPLNSTKEEQPQIPLNQPEPSSENTDFFRMEEKGERMGERGEHPGERGVHQGERGELLREGKIDSDDLFTGERANRPDFMMDRMENGREEPKGREERFEERFAERPEDRLELRPDGRLPLEMNEGREPGDAPKPLPLANEPLEEHHENLPELLPQDKPLPSSIVNNDLTIPERIILNANSAVEIRTDLPIDQIVELDQPSNGQVAIASGVGFVYTPNPGFFGTDSFNFLLSGIEALAVTHIKQMGFARTENSSENRLSLLSDQSVQYHIEELGGGWFEVEVTVTPPIIDFREKLSQIEYTDPLHGDFVVYGDGQLAYIPPQNFSGIDSFTYRLNPEDAFTKVVFEVNTLRVNIIDTITTKLIANDDSGFSVSEDEQLTLSAQQLLGNDVNSDKLSIADVESNAMTHGRVLLNRMNDTITFFPEENYNGKAEFTYRVTDGHGHFSTATVTINVSPVNDAPVVRNQQLATEDNQEVSITWTELLSNVNDTDRDSLSLVRFENVHNGTVDMDGRGNITFIPEKNSLHGSFDYVISDGKTESTATIFINNIIVSRLPDDLLPNRDNEQPPIDNNQQPVDGQTPPENGEQQPPINDDTQLPPIDGQIPLENGEQQPPINDDTKPPLIDDEMPPENGEQPPVDDDTQLPPIDGEMPPENGEQPPVNDDTKPPLIDGQMPPENDEQKQPVNDGTQPPVNDGTQLPVNDGTQPPVNDGTQPPVNDGTQPPVNDDTQPPVNDGTQPPVNDDTQPPVNDGTQPPVNDGTQPPVNDGTQPPVNDGTQPPVNDDTQPPVNDGTQPPVNDDTQPPVNDGTQPPVNDGTQPPVNDGTQPPVNDGTQPPVNDDTQPPVNDGTQPPVNDGTQPPVNDGTQPPVNDGTQPPVNDGTQPPVNDGTQPPVNDGTQPPVNDGTQPQPVNEPTPPTNTTATQPPAVPQTLSDIEAESYSDDQISKEIQYLMQKLLDNGLRTLNFDAIMSESDSESTKIENSSLQTQDVLQTSSEEINTLISNHIPSEPQHTTTSELSYSSYSHNHVNLLINNESQNQLIA